jgi:CBS domain-containing protein
MQKKRSQHLQMQRRSVSGMAQSAQTPDKPLVSEIIGRTTTPFSRIPNTWRKTVDQTRPEYDFWSSVARGKESGYELGALFAKRIVEIDAEWMLGDGFGIDSENPDVDELVAEFIDDELNTLMTWRKDSSKLGDSYLIVNPDASLTLVSPDTADILTDPLDYTTVIGYRFTTVLDMVTVIDEYRLDGRSVTFQRLAPGTGAQLFGTTKIGETVTLTFENLIGMIPVVHLPNDRDSNEIYGHPMVEALLTLFGRYDDVIQKTADGVEIMGRPIPVAEGLEDPEEAMRINSTRTEPVTDKDGEEHEVPVVDFEDLTMLWLGQGGSFRFASPNPFSEDSLNVLKMYFYLMSEHTGIPVWAWGVEVAGGIGGDSVMAQMPAFIRYLKGRRTQTHKAVKQLVSIWLATKRLTEPVAPVEKFKLLWPELEKQNGELELKKIQQASLDGLLTKETELRLLDLVDDPAAEVDAAAQEAKTRDEQMSAAVDAEIARMNQGGGGDQPGQQSDPAMQDNGAQK